MKPRAATWLPLFFGYARRSGLGAAGNNLVSFDVDALFTHDLLLLLVEFPLLECRGRRNRADGSLNVHLFAFRKRLLALRNHEHSIAGCTNGVIDVVSGPGLEVNVVEENDMVQHFTSIIRKQRSKLG